MEYIRVDLAPKSLKNTEMVVYKPDFMKEIEATKGKRGRSSVATIRNIRDALMAITEAYEPSINPYHLKLQKYENLVYNSEKEFSDILLRVIRDNNLPLIDKAVEKQLLARDPMVKTVYYVSPDLEGSTSFITLGFHLKNSSDNKKKEKPENVV